VTLVSNAVGSDIVSQIRSSAMDLPGREMLPMERPETPSPTVSPTSAMMAMTPEAREVPREAVMPAAAPGETEMREVMALEMAPAPDVRAAEGPVSLPPTASRSEVRERQARVVAESAVMPEPSPATIAQQSGSIATKADRRRVRSQAIPVEAAADREPIETAQTPALSTPTAASTSAEADGAVRLPTTAAPAESAEVAAAAAGVPPVETLPTTRVVTRGAGDGPMDAMQALVEEASPRALPATTVSDATVSDRTITMVSEVAPLPSGATDVRLPAQGASRGEQAQGERGVEVSPQHADSLKPEPAVGGGSERAVELAPERGELVRAPVRATSAVEDVAASAVVEMSMDTRLDVAPSDAGRGIRLPGDQRARDSEAATTEAVADDGVGVSSSTPVAAVALGGGQGTEATRLAPEQQQVREGALKSGDIADAAVDDEVEATSGVELPLMADVPSAGGVRLPGHMTDRVVDDEENAAPTRGSGLPAAAAPVVVGLAAADTAVRFDPDPERAERTPSAKALEDVSDSDVSIDAAAEPLEVVVAPLRPEGGLRLPSAEPPRVQMRLYGHVIHGDTGEPLPGATVRLDLEPPHGLQAWSGKDGSFEILPEEVPDHVAVVAFREGFEAAATNVSREALRRGARLVFALIPESAMVIALEDDPIVHHLGNDEFTGRINSQFQRKSEGLSYREGFTLSGRQAPDAVGRATLRLLVKGAQIRNEILVNGRVLATYLNDSPADGSFGEFVAEVPLIFLREGRNRVEIRSIREADTDYDDFEFTNVRIELEAAGARPL
ncbi:MAG: hypothetical protein KDA21_14070, partial [Phycisphaerales bacterium]|nr:hypothetical protein [Phycisphaerales bacterium]